MPFSLNKTASLGNYAGLAIHSDYLRFIEIDESGELLRQESTPLSEGCIVNGSIKDFDMLESALSQIHNSVGKLREPVVIGLPNADTILRLLNMPNMSMEDIRGTIDLNFEEYFPISRLDAVFDTIRVITPLDINERNEITVLAAAAKKETVEKLLDISRKAGFPTGAVEPLNFSMLRAVPESQEGTGIFASPDTIVTIYNGNGIFFRSADNLHGAQDILNTIQFTETTYRHIRVNKLILSGLNFQVSPDSGMQVVNIEDEFFAARGLALRHTEEVNKLDLRPGEYVELEKRRYSFNLNRLLLWVLLIGFIMLSIGTISFTWMRIHDINLAIEDKRISNSELLSKRAELAKKNSDLEKQKNDAEKILDFLRNDIPVLEIMNAIEKHMAVGVKLETADFSRNPLTGVTVIIDGKASSEQAIVSTSEGLKTDEVFADVRLPVSQRAQTGQIIFKLILRVKEIN